MPGKGILLWSESHPRAQPKRQSNWGCSPAVAPPCCCSPCCCCCCCSLGCCYTQIARGNWQPLKESMQVAAAAAAVGCCLLVVAPCWLTSIEARWMLSWEFAAQFDVTSNAQLATCNGQLGAAPELTLPPSKSARSWQYSHWAALRKTELQQTWSDYRIESECIRSFRTVYCALLLFYGLCTVALFCKLIVGGTIVCAPGESIGNRFLVMSNLMMIWWMYPSIYLSL